VKTAQIVKTVMTVGIAGSVVTVVGVMAALVA